MKGIDWGDNENKQLIMAILALETPGEAKRFLRDLMTEKEIIEFGKRFQAANMLYRKIHYNAIEEKTGLSSTTVARVSKWVKGKEGGYRTIINRLHHKNSVQPGRGLY